MRDKTSFKLTIRAVFFVFLFFCLLAPAGSFSAPINSVNNEPANHRAGELLVKLKDSEKIYQFHFSNDAELGELIKDYQANPAVDYAELNYLYQASFEPNDQYYNLQTYLKTIQAPEAWNITTGSREVVVALLDSGVDIDHPDLKNNIWTNEKEIPNNGIDDDSNGYTDDVHGWDFVKNTGDPKPKLEGNYNTLGINHGTVVAGIAAAQGNNGSGIAGVAWQVKLMPLRVLDGTGAGDTLTVSAAIDYAHNMGVKIMNLSFVGEGKSLTLEKSIQKAYEAGVLIMAAAGNEVKDGVNMDLQPRYPVCHDGPNGENWVIGVASLDAANRKASFSNYGYKCIDLTAPGVALYSSQYHNEVNSSFASYYGSGWTGTSVSVPQVVGTAALIKTLKSNLSLTQIRNLILENADNVDSFNPAYKGQLGKGRLNVFKAISQAIMEVPAEPVKINKIITSPAKGGGPHVRIFKKDLVSSQFFAHDKNFNGGLSVASTETDGDGETEVIVGLGKGTYPWVKIFSQNGDLEEKIVAYQENFRGGVEVAVGDVDGDGEKEIITAPGAGGGPEIRIFNLQGLLENRFFVFDKKDRSGLELAVGDVDGNGVEEIIVVKKTSRAEIRIYNFSGESKGKFYAFTANESNGAHLAAADVDADGFAEIIVGAGFPGKPLVRIFDRSGILEKEIVAYHEKFRGGVYVAAGDVDGDGLVEIVTGAGYTGGPQVRVFNATGGVKFQFFAYDERFRGGVRVGVEK